MKKVLLLLLVTNFCLSQGGVEIKLVNPSIGTPINDGSNPLDLTYPNSSNDPGLNTILQAHNFNFYRQKAGYPITNELVVAVDCANCNYNDLKNDLLAYSSVVQKAVVYPVDSFSDVLEVHLINQNNGIPTGINSNIITTNDTGLNQIFITHNVYYYDLYYAGNYALVCDCNLTNLQNDLNNYNTIIQSANIYFTAYLSNSNFKQIETNIYPNPFHDKITIETDFAIKKYNVFDLIGKKIIEVESNDKLNSELTKLNSGTYLLQLQSEDNLIITKKIIKN